MKVMIDADVLQYEAAFAAQRTVYTYQKQQFNGAEEAKLFCEEADLDYRLLRKEGEITSHVEELSPADAKMILRAKIDKIVRNTGATQWDLLLSGKDNYRVRIAKTKGYKANRADTPKPVHFDWVGQCLLDWGAEVVEGIEADDAIGIALTRDRDAVCATIDKDLNMIPGYHYDWNKGIKYRVNEPDAIWYFHRQMLMGDATDNIPGVPGWGEQKATNAMAPYRTARAAEGWAKVQEVYIAGPYEFKDGTKTPDDYMEYLTEQGGLLWIMRRPDEFWTPQLHETRYV
jgi:hypothetical protein